MKGAFIVFEGIDGSGKTTLCRALASKIPNSVTTAEPTHDAIGSIIRNGTAGKISQRTESLLFLADRSAHTEQIMDMVEAGKVVLCDRYFASTLAYQSAKLKGDSMDLDWLEEVSKPFAKVPNMTFLLDIDPNASINRVQVRGEEISKFEDTSFLEQVRSTYLSLASKYNFIILDASKDADSLAEETLREIRRIL